VDLICRAFIFLASLLGLFLDHSLYVLSVLLFISEFKVMKNVLQSIFLHLDKLVATVLVAVVLLYWYATWAYFGSHEGEFRFHEGPDDEPQLVCDTLWSCFREHFDYGLINPPEFNTIAGKVPF